jgi:peptide/nickel transport system permease protein
VAACRVYNCSAHRPGLFNGIVSARRPRSLTDRSLTLFSLIFYSMPEFLLGLLLLYFAYYRLTLAGAAWFPAGGYVPFTQDPRGWAQSLVLPWLTLALLTAATYTRLTRSSLLDVLGEDYIRTARAKGLSERRVVYRHGLRSALTPVVTQLGIDIGALVGGVVVVELVFSIDGLGVGSNHCLEQPEPAGDRRDCLVRHARRRPREPGRGPALRRLGSKNPSGLS